MITSNQITELTGIPHDEVMRDIRRIFNRAGIDPRPFFAAGLGTNGERRPYFILPRRECTIVASEFAIKFVWPSDHRMN